MDMMTTHSHLPEVVMPRCQTQHWLRGQTALVTGAGTGIGKEIALALAAYGADVAVNYVSGDDTARQVTAAILVLNCISNRYLIMSWTKGGSFAQDSSDSAVFQ